MTEQQAETGQNLGDDGGQSGRASPRAARKRPRLRWFVGGTLLAVMGWFVFFYDVNSFGTVDCVVCWLGLVRDSGAADNAMRDSCDNKTRDDVVGSVSLAEIAVLGAGALLDRNSESTAGQKSPVAQHAPQQYAPQQYGLDAHTYESYDMQVGSDRFGPPTAEPWRQPSRDWSTEEYNSVVDNPFRSVANDPLSTFSIDVDTGSYANVRRFLDYGNLPPKDAVRIEEMVNYFTYDYEPPAWDTDAPFAANVEVASAPWQADHRLVRIGLKGREVHTKERPAANLVFLLDVSGSMQDQNKLPLVKESLRILLSQLRPDDQVAMAVYAGSSGLVLESTHVADTQRIIQEIDRLEAGGSTNGGSGIQLAYRQAADNFIDGGINRVILATDGDFNVGVTDNGSLIRLIEDKAKTGVFLTVLGFGMGNYNDAMLEQLADKGNGNYAYIDNEREAIKVLAEQVDGTLVTIAKDVKIQVEFNPSQVAAWRLIGYENRILAAEDFNDDTKDAGEIGAGHTVTALYELVPVGVPFDLPGVDPLRYQEGGSRSQAADSGELLNLKIRFKEPDGYVSKLSEFAVADSGEGIGAATSDFQFAAAVAGFGMLLRESPYGGSVNIEQVKGLALAGLGADPGGYRSEFIRLADESAYLMPERTASRR